MEKYFRTEEGKLVDILEYTVEQVKQNPHVKIYIGTDSQVFGPDVKFTICIVYRVGLRGAHYIYRNIKQDRPPKGTPKEIQVATRLNEEVFMTMEIVQYLLDNTSIKIEAVEFDFNDEEEYMSNKFTSMATGWAKGLGLSTRIKPEELLATKAADHICKR